MSGWVINGARMLLLFGVLVLLGGFDLDDRQFRR